MQPWNENHYTRAAEFLHLVAEALGGQSVPAPHPSAISPPRPLTLPNMPKPTASTAAAVFKSIPWKK